MADWSPNNRAATTTWLTLRTLAQIPRDLVFKDAGAYQMHDLTFWGKSTTENIRRVQIDSLSLMMDGVFRDIRGASYEEGVTSEEALQSLANVLSNAQNTVADLAKASDASYRFWGEE